MSIEAMRLALEALEAEHSAIYGTSMTARAITSLRQAIADEEAFEYNVCGTCGGIVYDPVVPQPKREWVGLEPHDWPLPQFEYSQDFQIGALWAADIIKEKNYEQ